MPGRKETATVIAVKAGAYTGKRMAERTGEGRRSRPDIFTTRSASQRWIRLVMVARTAAAGASTSARISIRLLRLGRDGVDVPVSAGARSWNCENVRSRPLRTVA